VNRFQKEVLNSPLFNPLRKALGGDRAFAELIKDKVEVLKGDILDEDLGLSADEVRGTILPGLASLALTADSEP
jgi:hypothetical protein